MVGDRSLIYPPHALRTAGLSALLWFALRAALAALGVFRLNVLAIAIVALVCTAAVHMDLRRHSMHVFYANLGIAPAQGTVIALLMAVFLEIVLQTSVRALGLP